MGIQRYLPIVEDQKTNHILGLIDLGDNVVFVGDEESVEVTTPGGDLEITLAKIEPPLAARYNLNPEYMVAVFTHEEVLRQEYMGFTYIPVSDVLPGTFWTSGSGLANVRTHQDGLILDGLSKPNGFGASLPLSEPLNTVAPVASNVALVMSVTDGTWSPDGDITYQWQIDDAGDWVNLGVAGATTASCTAPGVGGYRCLVTCTNILGATSVGSNTISPAP